MARTLFNPVTTKWRGAIGGFVYSIVRGQQVIGARPSARKQSKSPYVMVQRAKFKLASQFSALWKDILNLNLQEQGDTVMRRAMSNKVAQEAMSLNDNVISMNLNDFVTNMNVDTNKIPVGIESLSIDASQSPHIVARSGDFVYYEVVAFDDNNRLIGRMSDWYISTGRMMHINLARVVNGWQSVNRWDLIAFTMTPTNEDGRQTLSNIECGDMAQVYQLMLTSSVSQNFDINGMYCDSWVNGVVPPVPPTPTVEAPEITYRDFGDEIMVMITAEDGATIYYTEDGSTPTTSSTRYFSLFYVTQNETIKAIAVKDGISSEVTEVYVHFQDK